MHISALSHQFVKDPREVVKAGDIVKVKVLDVDIQRKRIALSMRLDDKATPQDKASRDNNRRSGGGKAKQPRQQEPANNNALAAAFAKAKQGGRL